jgi:hypothetical protein
VGCKDGSVGPVRLPPGNEHANTLNGGTAGHGLAIRHGTGEQPFCGGPVPQTGEPTDLAHVVGDQTLEYMADQPASLMVCSKGYLFEKCGDHETAMRIFDRCIEAATSAP